MRSLNATTLPAWLTLTDNGDGTATLSGTPTNAEVGTHNVVLEVSDGSLTDTQAFTITVGNTNDAPTITSDGGGATASVSAAENQTAVTTVTASDVDVGDTPTFSISGGADAGLFSLTSGGVLTFNAGQDFETFADSDNDGVYEVEVTADDGNGGTDVQLIAVTVTDVNVLLGRLDPKRFGIPIDPDRSRQRVNELIERIERESRETLREAEILEGLLDVANELMADAIRRVADREGYDLDLCYAYSDSLSDLPMLEAVGHPVAVNPDTGLRRPARWIDGVLEDKGNIGQKENIRAMIFWGHAPNSQTRGPEMKKAMEDVDLLVVVDPFPTVV